MSPNGVGNRPPPTPPASGRGEKCALPQPCFPFRDTGFRGGTYGRRQSARFPPSPPPRWQCRHRLVARHVDAALVPLARLSRARRSAWYLFYLGDLRPPPPLGRPASALSAPAAAVCPRRPGPH